ncbi:hypothetical protein MNBD_GAMMA12-2190 [hydrothermal vent metagenome]|uniref:Uncharacterized protein n=1 Tax=hydrothermal vent metagenome TaxID=652676 RepID=A0A3B0XYU2_9ZZZZ
MSQVFDNLFSLVTLILTACQKASENGEIPRDHKNKFENFTEKLVILIRQLEEQEKTILAGLGNQTGALASLLPKWQEAIRELNILGENVTNSNIAQAEGSVQNSITCTRSMIDPILVAAPPEQ